MVEHFVNQSFKLSYNPTIHPSHLKKKKKKTMKPLTIDGEFPWRSIKYLLYQANMLICSPLALSLFSQKSCEDVGLMSPHLLSLEDWATSLFSGRVMTHPSEVQQSHKLKVTLIEIWGYFKDSNWWDINNRKCCGDRECRCFQGILRKPLFLFQPVDSCKQSKTTETKVWLLGRFKHWNRSQW